MANTKFTFHKASHYVVFSTPMLLTSSLVFQLSSSASYYETPQYSGSRLIIDLDVLYIWTVRILINLIACVVTGDQKVSVRLMITIHMSGAKRLFDYPV